MKSRERQHASHIRQLKSFGFISLRPLRPLRFNLIETGHWHWQHLSALPVNTGNSDMQQ